MVTRGISKTSKRQWGVVKWLQVVAPKAWAASRLVLLLWGEGGTSLWAAGIQWVGAAWRMFHFVNSLRSHFRLSPEQS